MSLILKVLQQVDFRTFGKQREYDKATKYLRDFGAKCIAERKKLLSEGKDLPPDIMSMVVEKAGNCRVRFISLCKKLLKNYSPFNSQLVLLLGIIIFCITLH